jgi:hypothetical protein
MRLLLLLLLLASLTPAAETQVRLVLDDGSLVKGLLIGQDADSVLLESADGKALELSKARIRKAFDAHSGDPLGLETTKTVAKGKEGKPALTPQPAPVADAPVQAQASAGTPPQKADWVVRRGHFDLGLHFGMDYSYGDSSKLQRLWEQMVPSPKLTWEEHSGAFGMSLGVDGLLTPLPWLAIGPYADWHFWAPGAEGSLKWTSTGYAYFNGYYWTVYPAGSWTTRHVLSLSNVVYGLRTRIRFLPEGQDESVRTYLGLDVGRVALSGAGYRTYTDGSLKQDAVFNGEGPALGVALGVNLATGPYSWLQAELAWQGARIDEIKGTVKRNDYAPAEEGQTVTVVDTRDGSKIGVDLSSVRLDVAGGLRF